MFLLPNKYGEKQKGRPSGKENIELVMFSAYKENGRKDLIHPLQFSPGKGLDWSLRVNVFAGRKRKFLEGGHKLETKRPDLRVYG